MIIFTGPSCFCMALPTGLCTCLARIFASNIISFWFGILFGLRTLSTVAPFTCSPGWNRGFSNIRSWLAKGVLLQQVPFMPEFRVAFVCQLDEFSSYRDISLEISKPGFQLVSYPRA